MTVVRTTGVSVEDYYQAPPGMAPLIAATPYEELSKEGSQDYWTSSGTPTHGRLVTDSATRNRLREKNAREQWRESQIVNQDLDRREQSNRWTCGYTGHVPRLRDTFAVRNVVAAKTIRPKEEDPWSFDGGAELLSRPSTSPQRLPTASSRPGTSSGFARVEAVCGGQRRLVASPSLNYPGNGFCGTVLPKKRTDRMTRQQIFEQGTKVDLASYYASCEASGYRVSHIQSGFAGKNKSNIKNGDFFYFAGKHMYETTQGEAYSKDTAGIQEHKKLTYEEEDLLVRERLRKYLLAKAVVGKTRIGQISDKIKHGLESRVSGGNGFRRRMFALFDKSGKGTVDPTDFQQVCHDLGVTITETEALAVYGTSDVNGDGAMSFHEFLAAYMGEVATGMKMGADAASPESPQNLLRTGS